MKSKHIVLSLQFIVDSLLHSLLTIDYRQFLILLLISSSISAQTISRAEYFFNSDPGPGNGTPITITPGANVTFTTAIPTGALPQGFHMLGLRVSETNLGWSQFEPRGFYITTSTSNAANLAAAEYFLDTDPGIGNGTPISITPGANATFTIPIPTGSLAAGFHFLVIRVKDASGKWGLFEARGFYITASTTNSPDIAAAEYFVDTDPGNGNGIALPVASGSTVNFTASIPTASLTPGFHFLGIRTKGTNGKWGIFEARGFYISSSATDAANLITAEYFFDSDPGIGNGTALSIPAGAISNFTLDVPTTALTPGFHFLTIRTKDAAGMWGLFEMRGFYVTPANPTMGDIVAAEYFYDGTDPGEGNGAPLVVTPGPVINENFSIILSGVSSGTRSLSIRVQDADGIWSPIETKPFTVLACTPPLQPVATGASRCNNGTLVLTATSGAIGSQVYRWYADATSTTVLFTGSVFTTPSVTTTTNFFVSVFDPVTLCESNRTTVVATVINTTPPLLNINSATICEGNSIRLSAPIGFSSYLWSNGEATREIVVTVSGNYTVVVGDGTCTSQPSAPAIIIVSARPAVPAITAAGATDLCDGAFVTLSAPTGFTYQWSNGATTQTISINAAGDYSVIVADGSNCFSAPSNVITVRTFTTPAKPVVDVFGSTQLCGNNSVGLLGPSGFTIYAWSGGQSKQGISVSTAGTHSLVVGNAANCLSPVSDVITVTATGLECTGGGINRPPQIEVVALAAQIEGELRFDLTPLVSDADGNINFNSLRVVNNQTARGQPALVDAALNLLIDYAGNPFTGIDRITLEVCDLAAACAQQVLDIDVVGVVKVFNGITPDGDGINDFLYIKYLDVIEGATNNKITILNRWGDVVYERTNYDNVSGVFAGQTSAGKELPSGTYFYKLDFPQGKSVNGFIALKR
ncbi:MAG: gliding motility-associated C-terminal domain-containing protein [Cyclobacteriaceae bacterium]|nr:gliding motility-associated C-terminal domain-containing protein [Cyclobacteriaceae bacterium]